MGPSSRVQRAPLRLPLPGPASPLRQGRLGPPIPPLPPQPPPPDTPHCATFIAGTGQEGPERGAQEKARPEGGPAGHGVAAGQRSGGAGGDSAAARGPPASRAPGPQAPHLLPAAAAAAAAAPRGSVQGSGPPGGRTGSRLLCPRLPARGSGRGGERGPAEPAEVCSRALAPSSPAGLSETLVGVAGAAPGGAPGCPEGPASAIRCLLRILRIAVFGMPPPGRSKRLLSLQRPSGRGQGRQVILSPEEILRKTRKTGGEG